MDKNEKRQVKNPRQGVNPLSALTFKWLFRIFRTGFNRELEVEDLYSPLDEHSSRLLGNKISRLWIEEKEKCQKLNKKSTPSLLKVIVRCFACDIVVFGLVLGILEFAIKISQPIALANFLRYFSGKDSMEKIEAFYWGTGIVAGMFLDCSLSHPAFQGLTHIGMKIRVACCSLIYKKVLKISKVALESETSIGQMINLLSNDVNRLDYSVFSLHYTWITPIQTAIISYLLFREVNLAAVGGIFTLLIFIPILGSYGKLASYLTVRFAFRTDERLKLTNEIISGIKVIKMYAWEKPFSFLVDKAREKEVQVNRKNASATEVCYSFESYIPRICLFVTILAYILFGNTINAEKVYLVTAYYNVLRTTLYRMFLLSIKEIAEALVSIKRLQKFLLYDEIEYKSPTVNHCINPGKQNNIALSFKDVTVKWSLESSSEVLKQLTFDIQSGSLTAVVGQVGAGKTTLLHVLLNEIPVTRGKATVNGKISYSSQEPWLFSSTIKQNILFGKPMNKDRYEKVIDVCQLKRDFQLLPYGENTLVGERGSNLSGGQCARINLARAVYHEADIYLLDDPLSAVDTHVGKGIFEDCIRIFLKNKTVVLITHQFHYLKQVDRIIFLENGIIQADGTYAELLNSNLNLTDMLKLEVSDEVPDNIEIPAKENGVNKESSILKQEEQEQLESRTFGTITFKTYLQYFGTARNSFLVILAFLISLLVQIASTGSDFFITYWVNIEETNKNFTVSNTDDLCMGRGWYIYVYASIIIAVTLITLAEAYIFFNMCMRISRNLHATMFTSIIHTTMAFFQANPIGRIMNRFSKDMGVVDTRVPPTMIAVVQISLYTFAVLIIVATVNPWFLIPASIIGFISYLFRTFYIRTSRSVKRLEGITRSPVFNHLADTAHGLSTIRALNAQDVLMQEFDNHQDLHSSAWFIFFSGSRAFGMYIELLCTIFTAVITYTLLLPGDVPLAGNAGLVISQCILLSGMLQWGIRQTTELENQMTSVERIFEYSKLPQEPSWESTVENRPPEKWPQKGQIVFKNVSLRYDRQVMPALNNLNFTVESGQMIGIVGRTGAGKSSIINAIFRLANLEGDIFIDNVATSKISLQELRSKISIIPQEPVLFAGTLRRNLDPFEEYTDHDLWRALEDVELKTLIETDLGLNMKVMGGGANFSVGQRQLLCLARAIVRNNKILVLDEATANVDPRTDELIQTAIRRKFEKNSVLIIAHRLNTVMDSSKILVMDAGKIVEFDHPYLLLQRTGGVFYNMVQQTGDFMAGNLLELAKSSYENKQKDVQQ